MKLYRNIIVSIFALFALQSNAQDKLAGRWELKDGKEISKYYFFEYKNKIYGLIYDFKSKTEHFQLEKKKKKENWVTSLEELTGEEILNHLEEYISFKKMTRRNDFWKGDFIYEEEGAKEIIKTKLNLLSTDKLRATFSIWGMKERHILRRVE